MVQVRTMFNPCPSLDLLCEVNLKLRTIKLFYFLTLSALATLIPYLPIFLSQIGIKSKELGVIFSLIFFLTFFKNIIVGFIADKYQLHKAILILSCMLTGPLYATLLAVPPAPTSTILKASYAELQCATPTLQNTTGALHGRSCLLLETKDDETKCCLVPTSLDLNSSAQTCVVSCLTTATHASYSSSIIDESQQSTLPVIPDNATSVCDVVYNCVYSQTHLYSSVTFWLCLTIGVMAALCGSNELMMNDAIALSILGDDRSMWGWSRLWGSLGYGLAAIFVSLLIDRLGLGAQIQQEAIDYTPAFYIYLVLSLSGGVVAYFHPTSDIVKCSQVLKGMGKILCDAKVIVFLLMILTLGFYNGIVMTYAYLYLRMRFMATQLNIGLCVLTTVIVEFPVFFIGGRVVEKIGTMACLYLALLAYAVRFLGFVYIPNPWWAILIETTHMFTFGLMFTAANMHAGKITSKGYTGTMIGLIHGIKWGLGLGLGSLLGAQFADHYNPKPDDEYEGYKFLFLVSGLSSTCFLVIYMILYEVILRLPCFQQRSETSEETKDSLMTEPAVNGQVHHTIDSLMAEPAVNGQVHHTIDSLMAEPAVNGHIEEKMKKKDILVISSNGDVQSCAIDSPAEQTLAV